MIQTSELTGDRPQDRERSAGFSLQEGSPRGLPPPPALQETREELGLPGPPAAALEETRGEPRAPAPPAQAPLTRYDLRVLQALRRIIRAVDLHSRKLWARHEITGPQLVCLLAVAAEREPVTGSAIARQVHLSASTVIGILDRLEARGLIRRERDVKDRRLVRVSLTEEGRTLVRSAPSPLQETLARAMKELSEAEQATIAASLERIVEMMEVRHIDAAPILESGPIVPPAVEGKAAGSPGGGGPGRYEPPA